MEQHRRKLGNMTRSRDAADAVRAGDGERRQRPIVPNGMEAREVPAPCPTWITAMERCRHSGAPHVRGNFSATFPHLTSRPVSLPARLATPSCHLYSGRRDFLGDPAARLLESSGFSRLVFFAR